MINNINELEQLLENYSEIKEKAEYIIKKYYGVCNFSIEAFYYSNNKLEATGEETYYGCTDYAEYSFPAEWLFLPNEELTNIIEEQKHKDKIKRQEEEKRKAEEEARKLEIKERLELERLKAKYEDS